MMKEEGGVLGEVLKEWGAYEWGTYVARSARMGR